VCALTLRTGQTTGRCRPFQRPHGARMVRAMPELVRNALLAPVVIAAAVLLVAVVCAVVLVVAYIVAQVFALLGPEHSDYSDVVSVLIRR
jgi:hypothetical protein